MDSNKKPTVTVDGSPKSKSVRKKPNQPMGRTSEDTESVVSDLYINAEETVSSTGTTNLNSFERRKTNNLKHDVVPSQIHPSLKAGTAAFVSDNPSSGGMLANEVPILPSPIIPLRDILEGGMNLGDSHLTYHSTLPKRKQKRPRITADQDIIHMPPQNSPNPVPIGITLGDNNNQYSVPKTTRILRENPEMDDLPVMDISGESSMPRVSQILQNRSSKPTGNEVNPEREPPESLDNIPSNFQGNFVEGLPGRVSFLAKQNHSSKGALEGGSSAVNVSKRPKQSGVPKPLSNDVSTNVYNLAVQKTVPKETKINNSELLSSNDSKQSNQKYHKDSNRLDEPDASYHDRAEPKLPLIDMLHRMEERPNSESMPGSGSNILSTTRPQLSAPKKLHQSELKSSLEMSPLGSAKEIIITEVPNVLVVEVSPFEKTNRNDTYQLCQKPNSDINPNNFRANEMRSDTLENDSTPNPIDQVLNQKSNIDHEGLAVPRISARKGPNQHRDPKSTTVNQNYELNPNVSKSASHKITDQRESAPKKKSKKTEEEIAKTELTRSIPELQKHDVVSKELGGNKPKITLSTANDESNRRYAETKLPKETRGKDKKQGTSLQNFDALVTTSSSIIDLPVPDYMNK